MNQKPMMPDAREIWAERDKYPPANRTAVILAAAAVLVCAACLPLCVWVGFSDTVSLILGIALLLVLSVYAAYVCRPSVAVSAMVLGLSYLTAVTVGFTAGAVVLGLVMCIGSSAFLFTATRRPYLPVGMHLVAFAAVFAVTRSPLLALLSALPLLAALLMGICTVRGCARTPIVLSATAGLLLPLLAFAGIWVYAEAGSLSLGAVTSVVDSWRASMAELLKQARDELFAAAAETATADTLQQLQQLQETYNDEVLTAAAAKLFHMLPAIAVVGCMIPAFLSHGVLMMQHKRAGMYYVNTFAVKYLRVSLSACVVYVISVLLMFVLPSNEMASAVAENLALMLMPPLCVVAVTYFTVGMRQSGAGRRALPLVFLMAMCCCSAGSLYFVAFYGVWVSLMMTLGSRMATRAGESARPDGLSDDLNDPSNDDPDDREGE